MCTITELFVFFILFDQTKLYSEPPPVTTVWVKITAAEYHVAPRIFSSIFIYFIHYHPLAFTFVHLHSFSSTFIKNCEISNSGANIFCKFLYFRVGLCFVKRVRVFMLIEVIMVLLKILVGFGPIDNPDFWHLWDRFMYSYSALHGAFI